MIGPLAEAFAELTDARQPQTLSASGASTNSRYNGARL